jgi:hypothetical protein
MKILFAASAITAVLAISPASAAMTVCSSENMAKFVAAADTMPDGPRKMAMMKEVAMWNTAMAKGDMPGACRSQIRAQRLGSIGS